MTLCQTATGKTCLWGTPSSQGMQGQKMMKSPTLSTCDTPSVDVHLVLGNFGRVYKFDEVTGNFHLHTGDVAPCEMGYS